MNDMSMPVASPLRWDVAVADRHGPELHSRVYTVRAWPSYERKDEWFFLFQAFEAMFYLCDRQGFKPEQVAYCGLIGRGAKQWHMWTAMEWRT